MSHKPLSINTLGLLGGAVLGISTIGFIYPTDARSATATRPSDIVESARDNALGTIRPEEDQALRSAEVDNNTRTPSVSRPRPKNQSSKRRKASSDKRPSAQGTGKR